MRVAAVALACFALAAPTAAQDVFSLGLEELALQAEGPPAVDGGSARGPVGLELQTEHHDRQALVYRSALTPRSSQEFTLALWDSPMGRLYYSRAEAESMLGREGLVNGGRMVGLGMATSALGDQGRSSLGFLASGGSWSELTLGEKFAAGAEASFVAAIIYALAQYAD